jgi:hypothetical protein
MRSLDKRHDKTLAAYEAEARELGATTASAARALAVKAAAAGCTISEVMVPALRLMREAREDRDELRAAREIHAAWKADSEARTAETDHRRAGLKDFEWGA